MKQFIDDYMIPSIGIGSVVMVFSVLITIMWLEGHANAKLLHDIKHIDMPWYYAAFTDVNINSVDATVK